VAEDSASREAVQAQLAAVEAALSDNAAWRGALGTAVSELSEALKREGSRRIETRLVWAYGSTVQRGEVTSLSDLIRDLDREVTAMHGMLLRCYTTGLTRMVRQLQIMLGAGGLAGLVNDLAPAGEQQDAMPTVQAPSLFDSIDEWALRDAATSASSAVAFSLAMTNVATGAGTATAAPGVASTVLVAPTAASGSAMATGAASAAALGPALVVGAFVGVAVLGLKAYKNHKAAQVRRAAQALERAELAANEILRDFVTQAEALRIDGTALVEQRLIERRRELDQGQTQHDSQRRVSLRELDRNRAAIESLQAERAALREAIAGRLAG
jgi:hypothetical protein